MEEATTDIQRVTCCPGPTMVEVDILASLAMITIPRHPHFLEISSKMVGGTARVTTQGRTSLFERGKRNAKRANITTIFLPEAAGLTRKNTTVACSAGKVVAQSLAAAAGTITGRIPTNDGPLSKDRLITLSAFSSPQSYLGRYNMRVFVFGLVSFQLMTYE